MKTDVPGDHPLKDVSIDNSQSSGITRREFVATVGIVTGGVVLYMSIIRATSEFNNDASGQRLVSTELFVNGQKYKLTLDPRVTLLDTLREYLGFTGTKKGCYQGQCDSIQALWMEASLLALRSNYFFGGAFNSNPISFSHILCQVKICHL